MKQYYLGVMSGTSLDGMDLALLDFSTSPPTMIAQDLFSPMPWEIRQKLTALFTGSTTLQQLGELEHQLGKWYAQAINQFLVKVRLKSSDIIAVGCHGQTVWHSPDGENPFTMQIGDMNIVAAETNITVVADFRRKDMALGGQGAPLVPAFHQSIWEKRDRLRVILNIGGISNISVLHPEQPVIGYDTGVGNALMDSWIERYQGKPFDYNGDWAATGSVDQGLLSAMLSDPYFQRLPPKSTGREYFNLAWLESILAKYTTALSPESVQATLLDFTAQSIANELHQLITVFPRELFVCGGGARNQRLMQRLQSLLPDWQVSSTTDQGLDGDFVEAAAFAWLAYQRLHNLPSNLPSVTGAKSAVSLGVIFPKN